MEDWGQVFSLQFATLHSARSPAGTERKLQTEDLTPTIK
jgi:hypothetical protein